MGYYYIDYNFFYFAFIFGKAGIITRIGPEQYYKRNFGENLREFISRRFEGVALEYFHRQALSGKMDDIEDFGCYWYDDPVIKLTVSLIALLKGSAKNTTSMNASSLTEK